MSGDELWKALYQETENPLACLIEDDIDKTHEIGLYIDGARDALESVLSWTFSDVDVVEEVRRHELERGIDWGEPLEAPDLFADWCEGEPEFVYEYNCMKEEAK